ncbi:MAG TPA: transporter [Chthoniobacterales bacterium]|nr:transporter [Chthoniobacterales bacterium]
MKFRALLFAVFIVVMFAARGDARDSISEVEKAPGRLADGVQDNSFLVEEAYNQEPGMVQHTLNIVRTVSRRAGPDERALSFVFTEEWPVITQAHQFSYTIPYTFLKTGHDSADGIEDVSLSYRFQLCTETATRPAFAPGVSLILPTGDEERGFGDGAVGYQTNLPVSKVVSERWTVHGNAGASYLPDVSGHDLVGYNLGASAIFAVSSNFNLMLEAVAEWEEDIDDRGSTDRNLSAVISPGFRYAFNHPNDAQTVIGLAVPIGLTSAAPDYGIFLYASFEHFFRRSK